MNVGRTVFAQLLDHLPSYEFQKCVTRYRGDYQQKAFSCWDQYLAMAFAQLTYRDSLRDIEACLRSMQGKLYHMGFRGKVARSTLADANESRDWRIYADFAQMLIGAARPLYAHDPIGVDLEQSLYALDSTTIDLCLTLFPWARFRQHKAAVKMHTLLDLHGNIPTFIRITDGKVHDSQHPRRAPSRSGRVLRNGSWLHRFPTPLLLHSVLRFFCRTYQTQCLTPTALFAYGGQEYRRTFRSHRHPNRHGVCQSVSGCIAASYFDAETNKRLKFLTNNFTLPALTIAQTYRYRWQVELFFAGSSSTSGSSPFSVPASGYSPRGTTTAKVCASARANSPVKLPAGWD